MSQQIKSKARVSAHGEVFTADREVNAMLDLVKEETERIDSRFLEPACGNGNFLAKILERKLMVVRNRYAKNRADWELYALIAVGSAYGIEILQDNVDECRKRLYAIFLKEYQSIFPEQNVNTEEYLKKLFIGQSFTEIDQWLENVLERRYGGSSKKAVLVAYQNALKRYQLMKRSERRGNVIDME